jgi:hypothetical protein
MYQKKRKFTKSERKVKPCETLIEKRGTQEFVTHKEDEKMLCFEDFCLTNTLK